MWRVLRALERSRCGTLSARVERAPCLRLSRCGLWTTDRCRRRRCNSPASWAECRFPELRGRPRTIAMSAAGAGRRRSARYALGRPASPIPRCRSLLAALIASEHRISPCVNRAAHLRRRFSASLGGGSELHPVDVIRFAASELLGSWIGASIGLRSWLKRRFTLFDPQRASTSLRCVLAARAANGPSDRSPPSVRHRRLEAASITLEGARSSLPGGKRAPHS